LGRQAANGAAPPSEPRPRARRLEGSDAWVLVSERSDGDLALTRNDLALLRSGVDHGPRTADAAEELRRRLVDRRWVLPRQVHGARVLLVESGSPPPAGSSEQEADALVSSDPSLCLAVLGADCGLVGLASPEGVVGVAHAGWRGLVAGVLAETVSAMRARGASRVVAVLGPCVHPCCYAFGREDLDAVLAASPAAVAGQTTAGEPALDLPSSLRRALELAGVPVLASLGGCTACSLRWYSHRARREQERHALALFRQPVPA
jgi:hypothetical protein